MRRRTRFSRWISPLLLAMSLTASSHPAAAQRIDHTRNSDHKASTSSVPPDTRLERVLLLLKPSTLQQQALDKLLVAQQTAGNREFHKWVTPADFANRFALSAPDTASVVAWLRGQGFEVAPLPVSRGWIEFSGSAAQVQKAFSARVVAKSGLNSLGFNLAGSSTIPAAIADRVQGLVSLDGSQATPASTVPTEIKTTADVLAEPSAQSASITAAPALTPVLFARWLRLDTRDSTAGAGETIAIPARSNVRPEDFAAFRSSFGLPESTLGVTPSGADPGRTTDEAAVIQSVSWASVAAPAAQIVLFPAGSTNATDGIDLALATAVDNALAHIISVGYTACENGMSSTHRAFYATLYRQAAAQGISIIAATGDSGAVACHTPEDGSPVSSGLSVNALASTPWNTAVSAVAFTQGAAALTGWQPTTATEAPYATGGGPSQSYALPLWQSAEGMPVSSTSRHRYLPDVSLPAGLNASASKGLAFCFSGDQPQTGCRLVAGGGSAASAAIFSGVAAVLAQKYGPQGNLAPNLYALRQTEQGVQATQTTQSKAAFVDVTSGSAKLWCIAGTPDCTAGKIGFAAGPGYDFVSGLGAVNASVLIQHWASPQATGTAPVSVVMTTPNGITYNPSAIIVFSAKVISGSGGAVPTGTVQFFDQSTGGNTGSPVALQSDGTASVSESGEFTNGGHNIVAIYSGDSTYQSATSQPITINIQPSPTTLVVTPSTTTPIGGSTITVTGTVTSTNPGNTPPSGAVTINLDGIPQGNGTLATTGTTTSAHVNVTVPVAGAHTLQGIYSGDINYNNSTSQSVTIAVAKVSSVTSISATPSTLTPGVPETFTATVAPATASSGTVSSLTGTVSFYDGGVALLGTAPITSNTAILTGISLSATVAHTITAVYSGDITYSPSTSSPLLLQPILLPVTVSLTANNAILAPGQAVSLTATVTPLNIPPPTAEQNPSGYVLFYAGTTLISGQVPVVQGLGNSGIASTVVSNLAAGQYAVTARYSGDTTFGPALSNAINLLAQDFTISCSVNNIDMVEGTTQAVTCNVISLGGLTGPIQVVCAEQNAPQVGAIACTFSPTVVQGTGETILTIVTKGGNVTMTQQNRHPGSYPPWREAGGGLLLACACLLLSPLGRRARLFRPAAGRLLALTLLLAGMAGAGLGCSNTVTTTNSNGTPLGVHTLKITAAAVVNTVTVSHNAYLTVNVTP